MIDYCLLCLTEVIHKDGWFTNDSGEGVCPWCIEEEMKKRQVFNG